VRGGSKYGRWAALDDVVEEFGYERYSDYNKHCIEEPREVLNRIYDLKYKEETKT